MASAAQFGRRYGLLVMTGVAFAGIIVLLDWWVDDKKLLLEYLKVLVWPSAFVGAAFWLRVPLRSKLLGLTEVEAAGMKARFAEDQANDDLERDLQEPAALLVGSDEARADREDCADVDDADVERGGELAHSAGGITSMVPPVLTTASASTDPSGRADEETRRRAALEQVIKESAAWGWQMAHLGAFRSQPEPVISWDGGQPAILYAVGAGDAERNLELGRLSMRRDQMSQDLVRYRRDAAKAHADRVAAVSRGDEARAADAATRAARAERLEHRAQAEAMDIERRMAHLMR